MIGPVSEAVCPCQGRGSEPRQLAFAELSERDQLQPLRSVADSPQ